MITLLLYIVLGSLVAALGSCLLHLFRVKVWLKAPSKREARLVKIGMMNYFGNQRVPEVHLVGRSKSPAIGRIKMGENDDHAYVELLVTDSNDDAVRPQYRTVGFVTQEGYIYQLRQSGRAPERIGYTARPSAPNQPTASGERNWKSLWLKCTLHAYRGEPNRNGKPKEPIAVCYHTSFHTSTHDAMPPETRAAAYALLFSTNKHPDYHEYYDSPAYGWKDTALLAAFLYAIGYVSWYLTYVKMMGFTLLGFRFWNALALYGLFLALWAIVRSIKIECIENSNTIQPKIDLFNKALGQHMFDRIIFACCVLVLLLSGNYYRCDFIPLVMAILTGVSTNMCLPSSNKRWEIQNPLTPEEDDAEESMENPEGDIARYYQWKLDSDAVKNVTGELNLYFHAQYITDLRYANPFYCQRTDKPLRTLILEMFHYQEKHRGITARVRYVASQIKRMASQKGLSMEDTLQFALDFVQEPNIRFCMNRDSKAINQYEDYIRFPDEVFYDQEADSNSKALLAAMLFHFMNYNVLYLFSRIQKHGAIGIEVRPEWEEDGRIFGRNCDEVVFLHHEKKYIFCETTSDGFRIGGLMKGMRHEDFDEHIELPVNSRNLEDSENDSHTCIYSWDLDSLLGNTLHGCCTLEFSKTKLQELRQKNPFLNYTQAGNRSTYEENIRSMFAYLYEDPERTYAVREIARYLRESIRRAQLDELDLVQFTLDFCQEPNITYRVDKDSESIQFAQEYMRFPDEVLFDKEGDCDCKSCLTAALFHELGYQVIIMLSMKLEHAAIGIEAKDEWLAVIHPDKPETIVRHFKERKYLYCETTGDGFRIGQIGNNQSVQDFDTLVEIPV